MIERYSRPEMGRLWSEENRLRTMLRVESVFLEILAKDKGIPAAEIKAMQALFRRSLVQETKGKESKAAHEVIGMLSAATAELGEKAPNVKRYLHYGLTSSDVLDTALALQLRDST